MSTMKAKEYLTIRISRDAKDEIQRLAKRDMRSVSWIAARVIEWGLMAHPDYRKPKKEKL